jgi:uncharacterized Tic20 family protein
MQTMTISPEERTLAAITHLSGLSGYIIPLGGIVVPVIIWIVKSESRVISSIAKQAILLNLIVFLLVVTGFVLAVTIILFPISILIWMVFGLVAIVLPIVGALKANQGIYYRYPVVGIAPEESTTVPSRI